MPEFERLRSIVNANPATKNRLRESAEKYHSGLEKAQVKPSINNGEQLELNIE